MIKETEEKNDAESKKKARELRGIWKTENRHESSQRITFSYGKGQSKGVKFIHHQNDDGTIETITDKHHMVELIMEKNQEKPTQSNAEGIPLRQQPPLTYYPNMTMKLGMHLSTGKYQYQTK